MGKLITIFIVLFAIMYVVQQSNFLEHTQVIDRRIGTPVDEYHFRWDNLANYFKEIPANLEKAFQKKPKHHRYNF